MKAGYLFTLYIALSFIGAPTASAQEKDTTRQGNPFIEVIHWPENTMFFGLYRPGTWHVYGKVYVPCLLEIEEHGLRLIPMVKSPGITQSDYDNSNWFVHLFKGTFIPFDEVLSFKKGFRIRMKNGMKYYLIGSFKNFRSTRELIEANLAKAKSKVT